ncbi:MAG: guanylate kinase [Chloroflexota bacterium]|nr:guanylate kinase [Chloroflexota bacterium]
MVVVSGPSGVGKDMLIRRISNMDYSHHHVVTVTTRQIRDGERDGEDYHFLSEADFRQMEGRGELLESAQVYGNWYGVPRPQIEQALDQGRDVLLKVDIQGAHTIKSRFPQAVLVFLAPSSMEELRHRLVRRKTESGANLQLRLKTAEREMKSWPSFDYIVINAEGELDSAVSEINAIITAEKCRVYQTG